MKLTKIDGVGEVMETKLNKFGIYDAVQLVSRGAREISEITGIDFPASVKLCEKAREILAEDSIITKRFQSGLDIQKRRKDAKLISTGTDALDKLLLGGVETGASTEVYGEFGAGKTQFCHTIAVRAQLPEGQGGLSTEKEPAKVLWIDTEDTFRPERIKPIAEHVSLDPEKTLGNIIVATAFHSAEQQLILEEAENIIKKDNIKLIIVDSTIGLFRAEYIGRGNLSDRQGQINRFVNLASHFARIYNIAVIFTNQVSTDPGQFFGDPTHAIGGNVVAHTSTYRIYFKKSGAKRVAVMKDSPHHPDGEVMFGVVEYGLVDPEVKDAEEKERKKEKAKKKMETTEDNL